MPRALIVGALALLLAAPASAQDSEDWDFGHDADRDLTIAAVTFDNFGVAVRCLDQTLSVVVSGVQAVEGEQNIRFSMADNAEADTAWVGSRNGTSLFSIWPASIAAFLREGGRLFLGVSDGERVRRMAVDLPASPSAIDRVFAACEREIPGRGQAQVDSESLVGLRWRDIPQPVFPPRTGSASGIAALRCTTDANGAPRDCRVESEFPEGGGFGRAAVLGAHRNGRVALAAGATGEIGARFIAFVVRYNVASIELQPPSRLGNDRATSRPPGN
ncbi:hypothetical protein [Brevundimonas sp. TWP2-3-4b1]|uniref:hypothetical protein n=1 Tax=Brevundimonas sp. TWP2-3-4b1 TaxID=2804580 RepID=UPI003CF8BF01